MKTYWTIQPKQSWDKALALGYLQGDTEYHEPDGHEQAYPYMMEQMLKRLPNYKGEWPVWLWPVKPDMRSSSHHMTGLEIVRLTVELDEQDVLITEIEDWTFVLNDFPLCDTEEEFDAIHNGEAPFTKEESWLRIFELDRPRDEYWRGKPEDDIYQGTTGRIPLSAVKKVEHFIAR